ncbi:hypothetical protein [Pontiella sp.]|uniref:hypothetical protein n=1 Tax=Pontiella sp. TaxID=2837462 RepID=UPI00356AA069
MIPKPIATYRLSSASLGAPCTYELCGDHIVGRLFGVVPLCRIHLGAVHYLRLAARSDVPSIYVLFNWPQFFLCSRRSVNPVYILQTRKGQRLYLKLAGGAHFKLRKAIARHSNRKANRIAA